MHDSSDKPTYDIARMRHDMALRGWLPTDLARTASVSDTTVHRFLLRKNQNAKTAAKLAHALGYAVRRYLIAASPERVA